MHKGVYEIFEEFEKAANFEDRVAILKYNDSQELHAVLRGAFHPHIKYLIEKVPAYKPSNAPIGMGYTSIQKELRRVYLFEANNPQRPANLTEKRMEELLIQILESLEAKEAIVFQNMLLKKLRVKDLNDTVIKAAFPHKWNEILG